MHRACFKQRRTAVVQNCKEENGRSPFFEWKFPLAFCNAGRPCLCVRRSVSQSVSLCVQGLSSIAPDRRSQSRSQKMRQSAGTTMALVTWRHVPPAWTLLKNSNTAAAQTGGGGWPGAQTFRARRALVWLECHGVERPRGRSKVCKSAPTFAFQPFAL